MSRYPQRTPDSRTGRCVQTHTGCSFLSCWCPHRTRRCAQDPSRSNRPRSNNGRTRSLCTGPGNSCQTSLGGQERTEMFWWTSPLHSLSKRWGFCEPCSGLESGDPNLKSRDARHELTSVTLMSIVLISVAWVWVCVGYLHSKNCSLTLGSGVGINLRFVTNKTKYNQCVHF